MPKEFVQAADRSLVPDEADDGRKFRKSIIEMLAGRFTAHAMDAA